MKLRLLPPLLLPRLLRLLMPSPLKPLPRLPLPPLPRLLMPSPLMPPLRLLPRLPLATPPRTLPLPLPPTPRRSNLLPVEKSQPAGWLFLRLEFAIFHRNSRLNPGAAIPSWYNPAPQDWRTENAAPST
ncbi:hypothetical protein [Zoogloea sp.]|uniref:hypothetical protein n=1 Tax=Zoogloea sp. TaxID=49181 RepID=UPI0035AE11F5